MAIHTVFLHLVAILIAARLCAEVAARLGVPSVVGELLAGIILGPSLLGWVPPGEAVRLLAEIGIILLLFEVGPIFAELGRTSGILPQQAYAGLVLVIAATTLIAPFGLKALYRSDVHNTVVTR